MTENLKYEGLNVRREVAKGSLLIAIIWIGLCVLMWGSAPSCFFLISVIFASLSTSFGNRLVRVIGFFLIVLGVALAINGYRVGQNSPMDSQSELKIIYALLIAIAVISGVCGLYWFSVLRAELIIRDWATTNEFRIICFRPKRLFQPSLFNWLTTSKNQTVYSVRVCDKDGTERSGWIRCGSFSEGVWFNNKTEVKWQDVEPT